MDATDHLRDSLGAAVALGNRLGAQWSRGRPQSAGDIESVEAVLRLSTKLSQDVDDRALAEFTSGGARLYAALALLADGSIDASAGQLNALLEATQAAPRLTRPAGEHGETPWHLHFASSGVSLANGWLAEFATAAAMLLGSTEYELLKRCGAERCDLLFLDATRNHTQRFCSTACQNRTKVAAFRARES
ncbi:CGNR zinc finger domain-containing protein [Kribbella sp. NPDC051718]|uniref:CGNR zinc finger domain-containing protein n=1 Tax=Kribbella sp. NPDC051718 TaxID=3155168 RepID=UPI00344AC3D5